MKYVELILLLFFLILFSSIFAEGISIYSKLNKENYEIALKCDSCKFISDSFINTCNGNGFCSLVQWQKKCKALWNLEYISWCNAKDFLPPDEVNDRTIMYGKWIGKTFEGEVYWEKNQ